MSIFTAIYLLGISACGIQGAEKAKQKNTSFMQALMSMFFSSFAGGIIRDVFILRIWPAVLTIDSILDIMVAILSGSIYLLTSRNDKINKAIKAFSKVADICGLGTFIAIGVNKGVSNHSAPFVVLVCGIVTSLGGGLISSLICNDTIKGVFASALKYRLLTILGTILYTYLVYVDVLVTDAQTMVILYTVISLSLCNITLRNRWPSSSKILWTYDKPNFESLFVVKINLCIVANRSIPPIKKMFTLEIYYHRQYRQGKKFNLHTYRKTSRIMSI